ncbi:PGDYG domain-containing protein [Sphingomonas nostoxanthinifaciens]|uniref:PGDYG domain-containing protein n=1 Tax=Sphingomonas nostoxanthinifaciens TaxID=2872652 RepID=UPI001CC1DC3D|nr:PGDYG domain-containing protein [Sphingomonas nostoxanthinifaciens]UAK24309.1 PGDYG domain-containing protein [Sphingomonas nostoxanthinifaciens]
MTDTPDLTGAPHAVIARMRPIARAVWFADVGGICDTLEGPVRYAPGDAIVTGEQGEQWPVRRDRFLARYRRVPPTEAGGDGHYTKRATDVLALKLATAIRLALTGGSGVLEGQPGDWLIDYRDGSHAIVRDDIFAQSYDVVGPATPLPPAAD